MRSVLRREMRRRFWRFLIIRTSSSSRTSSRTTTCSLTSSWSMLTTVSSHRRSMSAKRMARHSQKRKYWTTSLRFASLSSTVMTGKSCIETWNRQIFSWLVAESASLAILELPGCSEAPATRRAQSSELHSIWRPRFSSNSPTTKRVIFGHLALYFTKWQPCALHGITEIWPS